MNLAPLRPLAVALLLAGAVQPAGAAIKILTFGDSITEGWFDGDNPNGTQECIEDQGRTPDDCGYPGRLEQRLNSQNYGTIVRNYGKGGEKTPQGTTRINQVLNQNSDAQYLVLMEGTNDVTQKATISLETTLFNLRQMGNNATSRGIRVVIGTLIPRYPNAPVDPTNAYTKQVNTGIRSMAAQRGWPLAETFNHFMSLPNLFATYYQHWVLTDPVGHPCRLGHDQLANVITPVVKAIQPPRISLANPSPVTVGTVVTFISSLPDPVSWIEWDFGDGGHAYGTSAAQAGTVQYMYLSPGSRTVRLTATGPGGSRTVSINVQVNGAAPTYVQRTSLLPLFERGDGALPTDLTTQLSLTNSSAQPALAVLTYYPEVRDNATWTSGNSPQARVFVGAGKTVTLTDAVGTLFATDRRRGALAITYYMPPGSPTTGHTASAQLRIAAPPGTPDTVAEIPAGQWNAGARQLLGLDLDPGERVYVSVTNLDASACTVYAEVYDADGEHADSAVFDLQPRSTRLRSLGDIAFALTARPGPYDVELLAATCRYTAHAVEIRPDAGTVLDYTSTP